MANQHIRSLTAETSYTVNDVRLHVRDTGTGGPALILLHYFGGSSRTWHLVMDRLAGQYRCIAPDLRGWGDSAAPPSGYTVKDMADDIEQLLERMDVGRYVLAGHSMGGKVAQALAARRPAGLEALALIAPSPLTPEPTTDADRARLAAGYGDRPSAEETLRRITASPLPKAEQELVIQDDLRGARAAWMAWLEAGSREDISDLALQIDAPTQVLAGGADPVMTPDTLEREVVGRIAAAQLSLVPDAGHLTPLEAPDAVAGFLRQWEGR